MKIRTERRWSAENVREMCVNHRLYTAGDYRAYENMLDKVRDTEPTPRNLYKIAADILEHSNPDLVGDEVTSIMFLLEKEAVSVFYNID